jgi:hypothetical protein
MVTMMLRCSAFYRAMFRHIQMMARRGCCRTALECCKLLLSLDNSDPLALVLQIDQYALRSQQYEFLSRFASSFSIAPPKIASQAMHDRHHQATELATESERGLLLPNLYYSVALANFHIYQDLQEVRSASQLSDALPSLICYSRCVCVCVCVCVFVLITSTAVIGQSHR